MPQVGEMLKICGDMKRYFLFLTAAVFTASMMLTGCGKDDDDNSGGKGGTLTITGIPTEYNGKYVCVWGSKDPDNIFYDFGGCKSNDKASEVTHFVKISGGEAKVPMWLLKANLSTFTYSYSPYTGDDKGVEIVVEVYEEASMKGAVWSSLPIRERTIDEVDFTNGNATVEWGAEPKGFVGWWRNDDLKLIEFYKNGTWNISHFGIICYKGTYTSSGKTAQMTITWSDYDDGVGVKGVGTIAINKLTVSGFAKVEDGFGKSFLDGEYFYDED